MPSAVNRYRGADERACVQPAYYEPAPVIPCSPPPADATSLQCHRGRTIEGIAGITYIGHNYLGHTCMRP